MVFSHGLTWQGGWILVRFVTAQHHATNPLARFQVTALWVSHTGADQLPFHLICFYLAVFYRPLWVVCHLWSWRVLHARVTVNSVCCKWTVLPGSIHQSIKLSWVDPLTKSESVSVFYVWWVSAACANSADMLTTCLASLAACHLSKLIMLWTDVFNPLQKNGLFPHLWSIFIKLPTIFQTVPKTTSQVDLCIKPSGAGLVSNFIKKT